MLELLHDREAFLLELRQAGRRAGAGSRKDDLFGYQNSRKARIGGLGGLQDPALMARKARAENELRERIEADPEQAGRLRRRLGQDRRGAEGRGARSLRQYNLLERGLRLRLAALRDRPDPGPPGRGDGQAQRRAAPRVPRLRASSRSSWRSSPTPRSTPSTRRPSSPTRSPSGRRACRTTRWSSSVLARPVAPSRRPRSWSRAPSSPTSPSARRSPRGARRRSRRPTTR